MFNLGVETSGGLSNCIHVPPAALNNLGSELRYVVPLQELAGHEETFICLKLESNFSVATTDGLRILIPFLDCGSVWTLNIR